MPAEGRDHPPRDERSEPARCPGEQLQGAFRGGTRPRLPVAPRPPPARARQHRDLQPLPLRGSPGGPGPPGKSQPREAGRQGAKGKDVWDRRYREINDWERYLSDNGFKVVKIFLNLSKEEQRTRFLKRYRRAGAQLEVLRRRRPRTRVLGMTTSVRSRRCSPPPARRGPLVRRTRRPEVVRPALRRRRLLAHTLIGIDPQYPEASQQARRELAAVRSWLRAPGRPCRAWPPATSSGAAGSHRVPGPTEVRRWFSPG